MNNDDERINSDQYFHTLPGNLNCAQAVLKGFQNEFQITEQEIEHLQQLLLKEKPVRLEHDFHLAPAWIREIMRPVLKETKNE